MFPVKVLPHHLKKLDKSNSHHIFKFKVALTWRQQNKNYDNIIIVISWSLISQGGLSAPLLDLLTMAYITLTYTQQQLPSLFPLAMDGEWQVAYSIISRPVIWRIFQHCLWSSFYFLLLYRNQNLVTWKIDRHTKIFKKYLWAPGYLLITFLQFHISSFVHFEHFGRDIPIMFSENSFLL